MVVCAVGRAPGQRCLWRLDEHVLVASSAEQAREWVALVRGALQAMCHDR